MAIDLKNLPQDPESLHGVVSMLLSRNESLMKQIQAITSEKESLILEHHSLAFTHAELLQEHIKLQSEHQKSIDGIKDLKNRLKLGMSKLFGRKSEKLSRKLEEIIDGLDIVIEDHELEMQKCLAAIAAIESANSSQDLSGAKTFRANSGEKKHPKRQKLPEDLPRNEVLLSPDLICPECGFEEFSKIADDVSESLEYVPGYLRVKKYVRPRCSCVRCNKIVQAELPSRPISKGMAESSLLAHILIQKYCDHLPLYRQAKILERAGIFLARSTLTSWIGSCAYLLDPLVDELKRQIFASSHIHGDDTIVKVLVPGSGKTKTARFWGYVRDGRPHGDTTPSSCLLFLLS